MERTFLIQRYASCFWDRVRGLRPFLAAGPVLEKHVAKDSRRGFCVRLSLDLERALRSVDGRGPRDLQREVTARFLLSEGLVESLWSTDAVGCLPEVDRSEASVVSLSDELHGSGPVSETAMELLTSLSDPSYYRQYVSEDGLTLSQVPMSSFQAT